MDSMKAIHWRRPFGYAGLISFGLIVGVALSALIKPGTFGKDAPAWVQAIGSIVAILIAIAIPALQHLMNMRAQQRDRADRARSLGLLLLPHINSFAEQNNKIWSDEHPDHDVENLSENSCIAKSKTIGALNIPPEIIACIDKLHELGPAAHGLQRAVFNVVAAQELVTKKVLEGRYRAGLAFMLPSHVIVDKVQFYDLMWGALSGLAESQSKIEALFKLESRPTSH